MRGVPWEQIYPLFVRAFQLAPLPLPSLRQLLFLAIKSNDLDQGEKIIEMVEKIPTKKDRDLREKRSILVYKALWQWRKGEISEAWDTIMALREENFRNTPYYGFLGFIANLVCSKEEALEYCREAYDYDETDMVILDNLGSVLLDMDRNVEAAEIYDKLMELNPHFVEAWYNYGRLLKAQGRLDEARVALKKAAELPFTGVTTIKKDDLQTLQASLSNWS